jgi:hypothetical protein
MRSQLPDSQPSVTPNADNEPTRIWFQWGTSTNYGNSTAVQTISSNLVNAGISIAAIVNPAANTPYHFRAVAGHTWERILAAIEHSFGQTPGRTLTVS